MNFFDIENTAFTILGYDLSFVELIGTFFGFISVFLASRANILTWPAGIINEAAFFILFYQVQLYSDMYLQIYFFGLTIYGWYYWNKQGEERSVSVLSAKWRIYLLLTVSVATIFSGLLISQVHELLPAFFSKPAAYPYWDAFTTVSSIIAAILLSRKIIENWILWILVDIVSVVLYTYKGIYVVAIEYMFFLIICVFGFHNWRKTLW